MSYYDWTTIMKGFSVNELNKVVNEYNTESDEKVSAALTELKNRGIETSNYVQNIEKQIENTKTLPTVIKKGYKYIGWIVAFIVILGATLPFHWVFHGSVRVLLKDNLTFSNTFVTKSDVDKLIQRHNNASFFEQLSIRDESLVRKLIEAGIIVNVTDKNNNE